MNKIIKNIEENNKISTVLTVASIYLIGIFLLGAIWVQPYVPIENLTRDISQIAEVGIWAGALSQIGGLLWCSAVTSCFIAYAILRKEKEGSFFLFSGFLSLFLLIDDYFLFHDLIVPDYLGLDEKFVLVLYPIAILYLLIRHTQEILFSASLILLSSLGFLGLSMLVDVTNFLEGDIEYLLEDGFKFLGIIGWSLYFFHASFFFIQKKLKFSYK
jgi:hypothetical protein